MEQLRLYFPNRSAITDAGVVILLDSLDAMPELAQLHLLFANCDYVTSASFLYFGRSLATKPMMKQLYVEWGSLRHGTYNLFGSPQALHKWATEFSPGRKQLPPAENDDAAKHTW